MNVGTMTLKSGMREASPARFPRAVGWLPCRSVAGHAEVLLVGFDATDPDIVLRLAATGAMPTVREFLERGTRLDVRNPVGLFVGSVWPSMFTAAPPAEHGRFAYGRLDPRSYVVRRSRFSDQLRTPFWSGTGLRTAMIDIPYLGDLGDPTCTQVAGWACHDPVDPGSGGIASPGSAARALERVGSHPIGTDCDRYGRSHALGPLRDGLLDGINRKGDLVESLLGADDWDLFAVTFMEGHCIGHQCWHVHDPEHPQHDAVQAAALGDPLVDVYQALDAALGRVVAARAGAGTVLLYFSHGMGPHYGHTFHLGEILHRLAPLFTTPSRSAKVMERARQDGYRARRRLRRARGLPPDGSLRLADSTLPFFPVPTSDVYGGVRINLAGRELRGRVQPGPEYEAVCERLEAELRAIVLCESGEPFVREVVRVDDHHRGPARAAMPDLLVHWNHAVPVGPVRSPTFGSAEWRYGGHRTGNHRPDGLLLVGGPLLPSEWQQDAIDVTAIGSGIVSLLGAEPCSG